MCRVAVKSFGNCIAGGNLMRSDLVIVHNGLMISVFSLSFVVPSFGHLALTGSTPGSPAIIFNTDRAVLESGEARKDLPCTVNSSKPILGFDLRYHSGYDVTVPLKELAGSENLLTILFRVSPDDKKSDPLYFTQKFKVPAIEEDAK